MIIFAGFFSLLCFLLCSCKQIILWRYGIHEPRMENPGSIHHFLAARGYPEENIFIFRDSAAWCRFLSDSVYRSNLPGTVFFSQHGLLDHLKDTSRCPHSGKNYVSILKKDTAYSADTGRTFARLMAMLIPLSEETRVDTAGADFYAVILWGNFLGKYNDFLFGIREPARGNKEVTTKPVFINIDMQSGWGLDEKQELRFRTD
jgi:hypothetical protein